MWRGKILYGKMFYKVGGLEKMVEENAKLQYEREDCIAFKFLQIL